MNLRNTPDESKALRVCCWEGRYGVPVSRWTLNWVTEDGALCENHDTPDDYDLYEARELERDTEARRFLNGPPLRVPLAEVLRKAPAQT